MRFLIRAVSALLSGWLAASVCVRIAAAEVSAPELLFHQAPETFSTETPWQEWSAFPTVSLERDEALQATGDEDLSGEAVLAWNSAALFTVVRVRDDVFSPNDVFDMFWNGDSIQIAVDPANDTGQQKSDANDVSIGAAAFPLGNRVLTVQVPRYIKEGVLPGVPFECWREGIHTTYVLAVPWAYLAGLNPLLDRPFRFNLIVNDNDGGKREGWLELSDGIGEGLNVSRFRTAHFLRSAEEPMVHLSTTPRVLDIAQDLALQVTARNAGPGMTLSVHAGSFSRTLKPAAAAETAVVEQAVIVPAGQLPVGQTPITVELLSPGGKQLAISHVVVTVGDEGRRRRIVPESRESPKTIENWIRQAADAGRTVDYLRVRAASVRRGIDLAEMASREYKYRDGATFNPAQIRENAIDYLLDAIPKLLADARASAESAEYRGFAIPRPDLQRRWQVHDGQVWAGDRLVTLHGWGWIHERRDPAVEPEAFAQNLRGLNPGPRSFMPNSWEFEDNGPQSFLIELHRRELEEAQRANEACDMLLSPHYQPGWFLKLPAIDNAFTRWKRMNGWWMTTDVGRKLMDRFYSAIASHYGQFNSLRTVDLSNEWVFYDATPAALEAFRVWLRERHGTIEGLNGRWGTDFTSFGEIPSPCPSAQIADRYNPIVPEGIYRQRGPAWDWNCFNNTRSAETVQWMHDTVRKHLPGVLTHNKAIFTSWSYRDMAKNFILGCDPQKINAVTDLVGTDGSHVQGSNWKPVLFTYDYFTSLHPDKPIFNSEWHAYPFDGEHADAMRRGKFQFAVHGERLSLLTWNTTTTKPTWFGKEGNYPEMNIGGHPGAAELYALTCADIRRLTPELGCFSQRRPDVLIFYDNAADFEAPDSGTTAGAYGWRCVRLHTSLLPYDLRVGIVTEAMLDQGIPEQPLIVLAGARCVSDRTVARLAEYAEAGGTILWMGDSLGFDHYGRARPRADLAPFTERARVLRVELEPGLSYMWTDVLGQVDVQQPFPAQVLRGDRSHLELLSTRMPDGTPLVFLANTGPGTIDLALAASGKNAKDLVSGAPNDPSHIRLIGNGIMLLQIIPADNR